MLPEPGYEYWQDHPDYLNGEWLADVAQGYTRLGYWDWVRAKRELGE